MIILVPEVLIAIGISIATSATAKVVGDHLKKKIALSLKFEPPKLRIKSTSGETLVIDPKKEITSEEADRVVQFLLDIDP